MQLTDYYPTATVALLGFFVCGFLHDNQTFNHSETAELAPWGRDGKERCSRCSIHGASQIDRELIHIGLYPSFDCKRKLAFSSQELGAD